MHPRAGEQRKVIWSEGVEFLRGVRHVVEPETRAVRDGRHGDAFVEAGGEVDRARGHLVGVRPALGAERLGEAVSVGVQALAEFAITRREGGFRLRRERSGVQRADDLLDDLGLGVGPVRCTGVRGEVQDRFAEPGLAQVVEHNFTGDALFGDEEHAFPLGEELRNDVRDRLALTGAGRTFDDERRARGRHRHCLELVGVGVDNEAHCPRRELAVHRFFGGFGNLRQRVLAGKGAKNGVFGQLGQPPVDLVDHGQLGEGEDVDHRAVDLDRPAGLLLHDLPNAVEECRERGKGGLARGVFEFGQAEAELGRQQVGERRVDLGRVIGSGLEADFLCLPVVREVHRGEDERRAQFVAVRVNPLEPAEGDEEHLDSLLAVSEAGAICKASRGGEGRGGAFVFGRVGRIGREVARVERDFAVHRDHLLEQVFGRGGERQGAGRTVVDRPVPARYVEQFPLPLVGFRTKTLGHRFWRRFGRDCSSGRRVFVRVAKPEVDHRLFELPGHAERVYQSSRLRFAAPRRG